MKLIPLELTAIVAQEIRRVHTAAVKFAEPQEMLVKRVQWKIENALRSLDAGECLPAAYQVLEQLWSRPQMQFARVNQSRL